MDARAFRRYDVTTAAIPNPDDWPQLRCAKCGRPTRYREGDVPVCKGGCPPETPLPSRATPVPVDKAIEAADDWEQHVAVEDAKSST
jgi:hypothetical protein